MSTEERPNNELLDRLIIFERELQEPLIPGEVASWVARVHEVAETLENYLETRFADRHEQLFHEIGEEDPGQHPRIEELRESDQVLLEQFREWRMKLKRLDDHSEALEPEEKIRTEVLPRLGDAGLNFVALLRGQEVQLVAWLSESLCRDRGEVD